MHSGVLRKCNGVFANSPMRFHFTQRIRVPEAHTLRIATLLQIGPLAEVMKVAAVISPRESIDSNTKPTPTPIERSVALQKTH